MTDKDKKHVELNNAVEERAVHYTVQSSETKNKDIAYMTGKNTKNDKKE
ncbi:hypothetical protein [Lacrimispora saccharolytica]|uniref:Uncharacterized protein n=1 Tax=Lacrimispora saccharolytica (strain ATCC 35040 / DSM 2544 / NRCC 2533 / WM1) TaxID=610130 RepID=D9R5H5_LACSW|nr:hypothetical protein [Lacrimispora saccharolytica]ADL03381.1 hypothetical protein Closa_0756 [[Clostridium] saccharolyticum WM1]QRV18463.1 hypothetical protein I6K70_12995 [Lacrimispora saccharolytica]